MRNTKVGSNCRIPCHFLNISLNWIRGYEVKKSSFFSKYISDLDTRIRGYVVRKSCFFSKCISELDMRIRSVEVVFLIEVYL